MGSAFYSSAGHKPVAKAVHTLNQAGARWVPVNKSFIALTKIVLRSGAERLGLATLAVTLRCVTHQGYRHLVLVNDDQYIQIAAAGRVEEFIISSQDLMCVPDNSLDVCRAMTLPVDYQQQRLGYLLAQPRTDYSHVGDAALDARLSQGLQAVADEIVRTIKRYQTRYRAIYVYGDQAYWIGNSRVLRQLDQRIEKLAHLNVPVVIRGDKGTGKVIAARSLHCQRFSDIVPFIESDCREWQDAAVLSILQSLYTYAKGGTLFLRNLDALSEQGFAVVRDYVARRRRYSGDPQGDVRLLFSLSRREAVGAPGMVAWLADNAADLLLPGLQERRDDVRDLVRFFIHELGHGIEFDFTADAWQLLEMLYWEENVEQLKRLVQTLTLVSQEPMIGIDLLENYLPPQDFYLR
ncbi:sigma 54-interacting transcriptional regulator [Cellvibrio japonicus]|uniref:Sigma-54 interaction domain protein n=1 Tax=Cellvibrio japonicus (strain Ueda107) TaxID=498211 RepID=B3PEJ1_CELJU|nr:sigma 54-interacting transcriptional regulator [Cellvibrio japonicus]ACE86110.1 Sigma-54 interaction domain protein [Cellvibrio japonicus Ueda107]QEI13551.1 hypothetical protein FY117_15895 [Cellvibrio japonicus]QEI17125.1 hypothetical protein FY116_15900 [Cellvibrio japonicus]QEI20702.1 hypothetical protein FY115_15895 [Cellvibrio japonicus]